MQATIAGGNEVGLQPSAWRSWYRGPGPHPSPPLTVQVAVVLGAWVVHVLALGAEQLHRGLARDVCVAAGRGEGRAARLDRASGPAWALGGAGRAANLCLPSYAATENSTGDQPRPVTTRHTNVVPLRT